MAVIRIPYLILFCCTMQIKHLQGYNNVKKTTIILIGTLTRFAVASSFQNSKRMYTAQKSSRKGPKVFDRKER